MMMRVTIAFFGFVKFATAHSWLHCTDYRGSTEEYEPEKCYAHPREQFGIYPQQLLFGQDQGFGTQTDVCQSTVTSNNVNFPSGQFKRGQTVRLAWPSKNHVAATCTNRFIPDTRLELFVAPQSATPTFTQKVQASFSDDPHVQGVIDFKGFQNCASTFCDNPDKTLCTGTFTVPDLPDGQYSFQWEWVFNEGTDPYRACFEATISGDFDPNDQDGGSSPVASPTSPPDDSACTNVVGEFEECTQPDSCCAAGLTCYAQDLFYKQCIQPSNVPSGQPADPVAAPVASPSSPPSDPPQTPDDSWQGIAATTRYWDCCKPSCTWSDKFSQSNPIAPGYTPVRACTKSGNVGDFNAKNICGGGGGPGETVYSCPDNEPFTIGDMMYGFAAAGGPLSGCCSCYELEFTDFCTASCAYNGQLEGKRMVVQVTNTGADLGDVHFDLQIPGGGFGIFNGCSEPTENGPAQFDVATEKWGKRFGGLDSKAQCEDLPSNLQGGCEWRFDDFLNSDNPAVRYREVKCPDVLTTISGCRLSNEDNLPEPSNGTPSNPVASPVASPTNPPANPVASPVASPTNPPANPVASPVASPTNPPANPVASPTNPPANPVASPVASPTNPPVNPVASPVASPTNPPDTTQCQQNEWGACFGGGWNGSKCCAAGLTCYDQHAYYSQCLSGPCPDGWACGETSSPTNPEDPSPSPPTNTDTDECQAIYNPCGGVNWGTACCQDGLVCYKQDENYSQCRNPGDCPAGWQCD